MKYLMPPLHIRRELAFFWCIAVAYAFTVDVLDYQFIYVSHWKGGTEITTALASVLTILMAFRINAANNRWWEARILWGQLTNDTRNLILKVEGHAEVSSEEKKLFARLLIAFPYALMNHLRAERVPVPGLVDLPPAGVHVPGYVAGQVHETLGRWNREGRLQNSIWVLDQHARGLMDVCGASERICNTLMPASYRALLRIALIVFILISPWCADLGTEWFCAPILAISFFFMIGMELAAEAIEQPFGYDKDDLPLEVYCDGMRKFLLTIEPKALELEMPELASASA